MPDCERATKKKFIEFGLKMTFILYNFTENSCKQGRRQVGVWAEGRSLNYVERVHSNGLLRILAFNYEELYNTS